MVKATDFAPIRITDFIERTGVDLALYSWSRSAELVVSPRDVKNVLEVYNMTNSYRDQLLSSIGLTSDQNKKVYKGLEIHQRFIDPRLLELGQKFVYRQNYIAILENFPDIFKELSMAKGFAQLSAYIIVGVDSEERKVFAHYLPPIVEQHGHRLILMDGVHRNYLTRQAGYPLQCILIEGVGVKFPCTPRGWEDVSVAEKKPTRTEDRYWNLDKGLFRDVKYVGIDG